MAGNTLRKSAVGTWWEPMVSSMNDIHRCRGSEKVVTWRVDEKEVRGQLLERSSKRGNTEELEGTGRACTAFFKSHSRSVECAGARREASDEAFSGSRGDPSGAKQSEKPS